MNILIVNLARLGDIIQSTAMMQGLKACCTGCRISLMHNKNLTGLQDLLPWIDRFYPVDFLGIVSRMHVGSSGINRAYGTVKKYFEELRGEGFDRIVNLTPHYIGVLSSYLAGTGGSLNACGDAWARFFVSTTRQWNHMPFHLSDVHARIAGVSTGTFLPRVQVSAQVRAEAARVLACHGVRPGTLLVGLHTGGSTPEKRWPEADFIEVCRRICTEMGASVLVCGTDAGPAIRNFLAETRQGTIVNMVGKTSLAQLAALLERADVFVTNDSGPMHIAAACRTRVLSVHTGRDTCRTTGPCGPGNLCIEPDMACHPCEHPDACHHQHCRKCFAADVVCDVLQWMCDRETQRSLPRQQPGICLRTCAPDSRGDLNFQDLHAPGPAPTELYRYFMRILWDSTLNSPPPHEPHAALAAQPVDLLRRDMLARYGGTGALPARWQDDLSELRHVAHLAAAGTDVVRAMLSLAHSPHANAHRLQEQAGQLEAIDRSIHSRGATLDQFAPVVRLFGHEIECLDGADLHLLLARTLRAYTMLGHRCALLQQIGAAYFQCTHSPFSTEGGDHEHHHQRYAGC